jgi:hypothetical protein
MIRRFACNKNEVISHLRDVLGNLHWSSRECIDCEWVDHQDKFQRCRVCDEWSCEDCQETHDKNCGVECIECKTVHCRASINVSQCEVCEAWLCDDCIDKHQEECKSEESETDNQPQAKRLKQE